MWIIEPKKHQKLWKSRPGWARGAPRRAPGAILVPKAAEGWKKDEKWGSMAPPAPPQKGPKSDDFTICVAAFLYVLFKACFLDASGLIFHGFGIQNGRKIGPAWWLFGVLFPCNFLIRFLIVVLFFLFAINFATMLLLMQNPVFSYVVLIWPLC